MERNCIFCETAIDKKKHGLVKFCSTLCRNKYYYLNKPNKSEMQSTELNSIPIDSFQEKTDLNLNQEHEEYRRDVQASFNEKQFITENHYERARNLHQSGRGILANDIIYYLEENYRTKADLVASQLKHEMALKEIQELNLKISDLENELNEEPEKKEGFIGLLNDLPEWAGNTLSQYLTSPVIKNWVEKQMAEK
jgi:hypothetical protein